MALEFLPGDHATICAGELSICDESHGLVCFGLAGRPAPVCFGGLRRHFLIGLEVECVGGVWDVLTVTGQMRRVPGNGVERRSCDGQCQRFNLTVEAESDVCSVVGVA